MRISVWYREGCLSLTAGDELFGLFALTQAVDFMSGVDMK